MSEIATDAMDELVERLRASLLEVDPEAYKEGREAGREWVIRDAPGPELKRLEQFREQSSVCNGADCYWDTLFEDGSHAGSSRKELAVAALGLGGVGVPTDEFWHENVGDSEDDTLKLDNVRFLLGFVEGALDLWTELKPRL